MSVANRFPNSLVLSRSQWYQKDAARNPRTLVGCKLVLFEMVRFWIFDLFWAQVFEATAVLQLQCRLRVVIATNILVCFHHFSFMWSACHASFDKMFPTETLQIHLFQPACCKVSRAHSPQQIALNLITVILDGSSSCAPDSRKCWSETQSALWLQVFTERYSAPTIWSKC